MGIRTLCLTVLLCLPLCFGVSPVGPWKIAPGKNVILRYRFMVHDGVVKPQAVERVWHAFAKPPHVRVLP